MSRVVPALIAAVATLTLSACANGPRDPNPEPLTAQQSEKLGKLLGDKVAQESVHCLPPGYESAQSVRISENILAYRHGTGTVYVNNLRSSCPGLDYDWDIIVAEKFQSRSCSGDIIRLIDRTSGTYTGSCVLGEFTPYKRSDNG